MKPRAVVAFAAAIVLTGVAARAARAQTPASAALPAPVRGTLVTDTLWSQALGARKALVVYLPPSYATNAARRYPVAYYLHGAGGDETNWSRLGRIGLVMDSLIASGTPEMIVAMPDGDALSFYATSNLLLDVAGCRRLIAGYGLSADVAERDCVAWPHYDDYVAFDVVKHIDSNYRTVAQREARALGGLSMGGYGAITLALQYPAVFAAAASHSGVLSPLEHAPEPFARRYVARSAADSANNTRLTARWAPVFRVIFGTDSAGWLARDPATLAQRLQKTSRPLPALFVDVGVADAYFAHSRAFVESMQARAIPVTYREWPGGHTWDYWRAHVGESLAWIAARIGPPAGR